MRTLDGIRCVPLLVFLPGCAISARAGVQSKLLRQDPTVEGQATLAVGASASEAGSGIFLPVLAFGGGTIPAIGRGTGAFEAGFDYAKAVTKSISLRGGPRFGTTWGAFDGSFLGMRGGAVLAWGEPRLDYWYPVIALEVLAAPGISGDIEKSFVGGVGLSIGFEDYGEFKIPAGRPIRCEGEAIVAPITKKGEWRGRERTKPDVGDLSAASRRAIGRSWLADARLEHASIATFAKLSIELLAEGAPPELVAGAHRAALDEVRHAESCFALAAHYLGDEIDPGPLPVVSPRRRSRVALAVESLVDGALGEGFAAALAEKKRRRARDPAVLRVLATIAREEKRHAELAWDVIAWAAKTGEIADALSSTWAIEKVRALEAPDGPSEDLAAHGVPTVADARAALSKTRRNVEERLHRIVLDGRVA